MTSSQHVPQFSSSVHITLDPATDPHVIALLETHLSHCRAASPPEFAFALDLEAIQNKAVTLWTAWEGSPKEIRGQTAPAAPLTQQVVAETSDQPLNRVVLGCIALQEIDPRHGEIKTMHVRQERRGEGIAQALMETLLREAYQRSYTRLSLETGSMKEFAAARCFYKNYGFTECNAFGSYPASPYSIFYTRAL